MSDTKPWYIKGLRFACTECGKCCTGTPGYVWVTPDEIEKMAFFLQLSIQEFSKRYIKRVGNRFSLIEKKNYDCVFLKEKKCQVYGARPIQCQTFPYWPEHLKSSMHWKEAAKMCEGISDNAPLVSFEQIENQRINTCAKNRSDD
ncbi:MAG: YkgJ family cysteine cluster protein [Chlamydiia bacterium]|nr:YkgJ family cysteine cluster protein [Chlamydiia bacterium]